MSIAIGNPETFFQVSGKNLAKIQFTRPQMITASEIHGFFLSKFLPETFSRKCIFGHSHIEQGYRVEVTGDWKKIPFFQCSFKSLTPEFRIEHPMAAHYVDENLETQILSVVAHYIPKERQQLIVPYKVSQGVFP